MSNETNYARRRSFRFGLRWPLRLAAGLILCGGASLAVAFNIWQNSVDNDRRWDDPPGNLLYDRCSVNTGGSRFDAALDNVLNWQRVGKVYNPISLGAGDDDCRLSLADGDSEFAYVTSGTIDGALGRTVSRTRANGELRAADVMISTAVTPNPANDPDTASLAVVGRGSMLHEFGHFIGLDHDFNVMNIMRQGVKPLVPAHRGLVMVFPDDKNGALVHYEHDVVGEVNVFASAQTFLPTLPADNQNAFVALFGNPAGASANIVNYNVNRNGLAGPGFDWQIFNPDAATCTILNNAGPPAPTCATLAGPFDTATDAGGETLLVLCPGDAFNVPYSLGSRTDPMDTAVDHQVGVYLGNANSAAAADQVMLENNERDVSTLGVQAHVDRVQLSDDPDCILPGDYRVWIVADTCEQLIEVNENIAYSKGSELEQDNILRTNVRVRVLDPADPACGGGGAPDGMCDNAGLHEVCSNPPAQPPGEHADYGACSQPDDPGDDTVRGDPGCKCQDVLAFADLNEDGGFPDGEGSFLEVPASSAGQFCFGDDVTCARVGADAICLACGTDTNMGCPCFEQSDCEGVEDGLRCWGADDEGWAPDTRGTCLPDGNNPASRERLTELPWFCLDGCGSISPSGDSSATGCLYRQNGFDLLHGECVDVVFTPGVLMPGQCEAEEEGRAQTSETVNLNQCGGEEVLPPDEIVCASECNCHTDCPALGFPDDYGCSLFIGTGGTSVGRCVPPDCLNPKNELLGLCQMFL